MMDFKNVPRGLKDLNASPAGVGRVSGCAWMAFGSGAGAGASLETSRREVSDRRVPCGEERSEYCLSNFGLSSPQQGSCEIGRTNMILDPCGETVLPDPYRK